MIRLYREIEQSEGINVLMTYDDVATHLGCLEMGSHVWCVTVQRGLQTLRF